MMKRFIITVIISFCLMANIAVADSVAPVNNNTVSRLVGDFFTDNFFRGLTCFMYFANPDLWPWVIDHSECDDDFKLL